MDTSIIRKQNIYKRYDIIYASLPKNIGENELKLINVLHKEAQKVIGNCNDKNAKCPTEHKKIMLNTNDLAKALKINSKDNRHIARVIHKTLENLSNFPIKMRNWVHPISGIKYDWYNTKLVFEHKREKYKREIEVTLSEFFLLAIWRRNKYVTIDTNATSSFQSKYTIRLYEALMFQISKKKDKYIDMNVEILNQIFMSPENKFISVFKNKIIRYKIKEDMKEWLNFEYEVHKKDKIITFKIINYINSTGTKKSTTTLKN